MSNFFKVKFQSRMLLLYLHSESQKSRMLRPSPNLLNHLPPMKIPKQTQMITIHQMILIALWKSLFLLFVGSQSFSRLFTTCCKAQLEHIGPMLQIRMARVQVEVLLHAVGKPARSSTNPQNVIGIQVGMTKPMTILCLGQQSEATVISQRPLLEN